jgi:hypothetical protein
MSWDSHHKDEETEVGARLAISEDLNSKLCDSKTCNLVHDGRLPPLM